MKEQKRWNRLTLTALILMVLGFVLTKGEAVGTGKLWILLGALGIAAGIAGSSRAYRKHPCRCPVCGAAIRPTGRWLPGGFNGTNTIPCEQCGAVIPLQDLKQE